MKASQQSGIVHSEARAAMWGGNGGSLSFVDLDARMVIGYVPNRWMGGAFPMSMERSINLVRAAYRIARRVGVRGPHMTRTLPYDPFARGPFPVGVRTIALRDDRTGRPVVTEIWYPAADAFRGRDLDSATVDRFSFAPGFPEVAQRAVRDADPAGERLPVLLFCHGGYGIRREATDIATHLASHGYVVAGPDFPGDNLLDTLPSADGAAAIARTPIDESARRRPLQASSFLTQVLTAAPTSGSVRPGPSLDPQFRYLPFPVGLARTPQVEQFTPDFCGFCGAPAGTAIAPSARSSRQRRLPARRVMTPILEDLRQAVRQLRRAPGFAFLVVATLALGIGATSAAISLLNALVLRPLDVANPERLVAISLADRRGRASQVPLMTSHEISRRPSFEAVCAYTGGGLIQTEIHGRGIVMRTIEVVTPRYYEMLGVRPVLGRLLSNEDVASATAAPVTVISYAAVAERVWRRGRSAGPDDAGAGTATDDRRRHARTFFRASRRDRPRACRLDAAAAATAAATRSTRARAFGLRNREAQSRRHAEAGGRRSRWTMGVVATSGRHRRSGRRPICSRRGSSWNPWRAGSPRSARDIRRPFRRWSR